MQYNTKLWNYTILKLKEIATDKHYSFTTLWNHTILKRGAQESLSICVLLPYEITLFSNNAYRYIRRN